MVCINFVQIHCNFHENWNPLIVVHSKILIEDSKWVWVGEHLEIGNIVFFIYDADADAVCNQHKYFRKSL